MHPIQLVSSRHRPTRIAKAIAAASLAMTTTLGLAACAPTSDGETTAADPTSAPTADSGADTGETSASGSDTKDAGDKDYGEKSAKKSDQKSGKKSTHHTKSNVMRAGAKLRGMSAAKMLDKLTVKGKAPATGYDRNRWFGKAWTYDFDHNGCRTRDDILARDMTKVHYKNSGMCKVSSGTLKDPYDGKTDNWSIGKDSVDIDHMVALQNAWISGAQYWKGSDGQTQRESIANDPLNLVAADSALNRAKGAGNAAEWLPKNKSFRCQYVATQISVKYKYRLAVAKPEKAAMNRLLDKCPGQKAAKVSRLDIATGSSVAVGAGKSSGKSKSSSKDSDSSGSSHGSGNKGSGSKGSGDKGSGSGSRVSKTVHPGAYCKKTEAGAKGTADNGNTYTCKTSSTDSRLRWRQ